MLPLPGEKHARLRAIKNSNVPFERMRRRSNEREPFPVRTVTKYGLSFGLSNDKLEHAVVDLTSLQRTRKRLTLTLGLRTE